MTDPWVMTITCFKHAAQVHSIIHTQSVATRLGGWIDLGETALASPTVSLVTPKQTIETHRNYTLIRSYQILSDLISEISYNTSSPQSHVFQIDPVLIPLIQHGHGLRLAICIRQCWQHLSCLAPILCWDYNPGIHSSAGSYSILLEGPKDGWDLRNLGEYREYVLQMTRNSRFPIAHEKTACIMYLSMHPACPPTTVVTVLFSIFPSSMWIWDAWSSAGLKQKHDVTWKNENIQGPRIAMYLSKTRRLSPKNQDLWPSSTIFDYPLVN